MVNATRKNIRIAGGLVRCELERIECDAICPLDGARADSELRGNFDAGAFCNPAHNQSEPAKYVEASMNGIGVFDQPFKKLN